MLERLILDTRKVEPNSQSALAPASRTEKESGTLVIDTVPDSARAPRDLKYRDILFWEFKYLIPANHLAQVVFVSWSNGVPTIKPRWSGYFKVGPKPVSVERMAINCDPHMSGTLGETSVAKWSVSLGFGYTRGHSITNQPPCHKLETAPRSVLDSGDQLSIRLAEFIQPAGSASNGWSGAEIRLFLQPLLSPAVLTDPNEFDRTNYVAGWGLGRRSEDSIIKALENK